MEYSKSPLLLTGIVLISIIISCKKDNSNPTYDGPKIKTHTYTHLGLVIDNYTYDNNGRLTSVTSDGAGSSITETFTYSGNTVTLNIDGRPDYWVYTLNSEGYATLLELKASNNTVMSSFHYAYDSVGHLISDDNNTYLWSEDNQVITITSSDTVTQIYLTDKLNTIGHANEGLAFLGKDSKNLLSMVITSNGTINYSYEFDSQNRVTKIPGSDPELYTYY